MTDAEDGRSPGPSSGIARAGVGLVQGLALYLLFDAYQARGWVVAHDALFTSLVAVSIFAPLVVVAGLTRIRLPLLAGWTAAVVLMCAALGFHAIDRMAPSPEPAHANLPPVQFWGGLTLLVFVLNSLVTAAATDRRLIARYGTYFDVAWKSGLQVLLAEVFVVVFWLILWLGADLFGLIKLDFLSKLIARDWFRIPVTVLVFDYAVHVTDVRARIIRGVRTLSCNLLSWLLPLLTLIVVGFIGALVVTGLQPLWATRRAGEILLGAATVLIFLINAAYQDGYRAGSETGGPDSPPRVLRGAIALASIALLPLAALAIDGLRLRIEQYGWSPERVLASAYSGVVLCYAAGYLIAVVRGRLLQPKLDGTNVASAFAMVVVLLALLTPLADPARIAVADQVRRLQTGQVTPEAFDYAFLRFSSGRYGLDALGGLAEQTASTDAAGRAAAMLRQTSRSAARRLIPTDSREIARHIKVAYPAGTALPDAFLRTQWNATSRRDVLPPCLTGGGSCDALVADIDGDGSQDIVLFPSPAGRVAVFSADRQQAWSQVGWLDLGGCEGLHEALLAGHFELTTPTFKQFSVDGTQVQVSREPECAALTKEKQ